MQRKWAVAEVLGALLPLALVWTVKNFSNDNVLTYCGTMCVGAGAGIGCRHRCPVT